MQKFNPAQDCEDDDGVTQTGGRHAHLTIEPTRHCCRKGSRRCGTGTGTVIRLFILPIM